MSNTPENENETNLNEKSLFQKLRYFFRSDSMHLRVLSFLIVVIVTAVIFIFRDHVEDLESYGYTGAFLISLVTAATIILPVPGMVVIGTLGAVYNPILIGLAAGAGSAIGELTGYMAGYSGQVVLGQTNVYLRLKGWMEQSGSIVIFVVSFVPNPIFDLAGATAGVLRYPLWKFLFVCFVGKSLRNIIVAYVGAWTITETLEFFGRNAIVSSLVFIVCFAAVILITRKRHSN